MRVISFFSGCGGMDLGFKNAGFEIVWANDNASSVWQTFEHNFPNVKLDKRSLSKIPLDEIPPDIAGVIGGPPCQSWSNGGAGRGFDDKRGRLFLDFIKIIDRINPLFFVVENVEGLKAKRNRSAYCRIKESLENAGEGYSVTERVLNASSYGVPQNRKRVFFVGYKSVLGLEYKFIETCGLQNTVKHAIKDLEGSAIPGIVDKGIKTNGAKCIIPNHEYWVGDYSYIFMSRNRVLDWDSPSYTLQASGRQTAIHPRAPKMEKVKKDVMRFVPGKEHLYRRLTVRECARIQTFPDDFIFFYDTLNAGYKMIGNAVPVRLAEMVALQVQDDLSKFKALNNGDLNLRNRRAQSQNMVLKLEGSARIR